MNYKKALPIRHSAAVKRYKSNAFYSKNAKSFFEKSTTSSNIKISLAIQSLSGKLTKLDFVSSMLATRIKKERRIPISGSDNANEDTIKIDGCTIKVITKKSILSRNHYTLQCHYKVVSGRLKNASINLGMELFDWEKENFICAPGASYNAGRFERHNTIYPPFLPKNKWKRDIPIITSGIPGFNIDEPKSRMDLLVSEITSPMIGFWLKKTGKGFWLKTSQQSDIGHNGFCLREDLRQRKLSVDLVTPAVRENVSFHGASALPSWDMGRDLQTGDEVNLEIIVHVFDCMSFDDFYACFKEIQAREKTGPALSPKTFPLSGSWDLLEKAYNEKKWSEKFSYYHAGFLPPFIPADAWSAGWTGGLALSYALLNRGSQLSKDRALRNLSFFFSDGGQSDTGIFYATSDGTRWGGDNYFVSRHIGSRDWIHVRRIGDYLLFALKHFKLLEARGQKALIRDDWRDRTQKCADAVCRVWEANRHFGQHIDPNTLNIRIGNSDAGGIIPAALAECYSYFGPKRYLAVAEEALSFYYEDYKKKGFTAGGPLETLCAPDCESAINLLESLVALFEHTRKKDWLAKAHGYADYLRTWFYTYDVAFPPRSAYGRMGVRTTGSILASSQNRCAVPNLCTLSGDVFWRLYRYTRDESLMRVIQECVHNAQQYVSRKDNPIRTLRGEILPDGTMHECIQTGDWAGPMGEIPYEYPTSWTEVAHMLSICELPGIYLVLDTEKLFVLDHLEAQVISNNGEALELGISNKTNHDAKTTLFIERETQRTTTPPIDLGNNSMELFIPAGETIRYTVRKKGP
ncbi:MAG: hypothetical protein AB1921_14120 [Thermodesulfobacteriota bacterium]